MFVPGRLAPATPSTSLVAPLKPRPLGGAFTVAIYRFKLLYQLFIIVFNVVPWVALVIAG